MFGIAHKPRQGKVTSWGYRIHDGASQFRFQLEGPLASADAAELDQCWRTASSTIAGKPLVIDITSLTALDESGRDLLNRWQHAGAEFVGGAESMALIEGSIGDGEAARVGVDRVRFSRPSLRTALPWVAGLLALLLTATVHAADSTSIIPAPPVESSMAAGLSLARYVASVDANHPWGAETVEIEASLPKLKEHGRLRAIRRLLPLGKPEYQVTELNGSRTVKQQVIARYLSAEIAASGIAPSSVAVTPANYQFRYAGSVELEGGLAYAFEITPRKKRVGLIKGVLWIDAGTGTAVRQSGYLVKNPSLFVKRVDVTRVTSIRNGVAESRVTHLALETRLVGRAELTIHERPCIECADTETRGSN